jgi:hypothetical protein
MSEVTSSIRAVYRRLAILPYLLLSARFHQHSKPDLAKERLLRATMIVPTCFQAHLRLGAIYLDEKDFYRAKREFLLARELNPGKFRRLYPMLSNRSGDININLFYFPGYTDREPDPAEAGNFLREFIGEPIGEGRPERIRYGDFASYREFRKFQEMGPFRCEELDTVDWEDVERRFRVDP